MRQVYPRALPGAGSESRTNSPPFTSSTESWANAPTRSFGPCRSTSAPIGRPHSCSTSRMVRHNLAHPIRRCVAHVDAKHVGAGVKQRSHDASIGGGWTQRGDDFGAAAAPHRGGLPGGAAGRVAGAGPDGWPGAGRCVAVSLPSVSWTVQVCCSPVSTSKKPVRSKPRARQSPVPLMVNSLSRVHMKAAPDHSPPRS